MAGALLTLPLFLVAGALHPSLGVGGAQGASIELGALALGLVAMQELKIWSHQPLERAIKGQAREFPKALEQERSFVNAVSHELRSLLTLGASSPSAGLKIQLAPG